jgi:histidinol dehydrogenase
MQKSKLVGLLNIYKYKDLTEEKRSQLLGRESALDESAYKIASDIIADVEKRRDQAVIEYTEKFDGVKLDSVILPPELIAEAAQRLSPELKNAFDLAAENITEFHKLQRESLKSQEIAVRGTRLGYRYLPVESAAIYVPGGKASYPTSVLMGVIPAKIAGVKEIILVTPPAKDGSVMDAVLYACSIAGVTKIIRSGGAQGIAAAAFGLGGTPARVIAGPGNRFVTAAKALLTSRGILRMDMPAGPSEIIVIADSSANPFFVASDMLSQAEHGEDSPAILLTDSQEFADAVDRELQRGIEERPLRREMKLTSIQKHSFAIVFDDLNDAFDFSNDYGPEHLEICTKDPDSDLNKITSAGSIFLGNFAPVALGDYFSGTNHVLPTGGATSCYSGLGVDTFLKRITWQHPTFESLKTAKDPILLMSKAEGLDQEHGHSVAARFM